jgi:hypothetical protein
MSSWAIIKTFFTRNERPGSMGVMVGVHKAAVLFSELEGQLKDREVAMAEFNSDSEVTQALLNTGLMLGGGLLREGE